MHVPGPRGPCGRPPAPRCQHNTNAGVAAGSQLTGLWGARSFIVRPPPHTSDAVLVDMSVCACCAPRPPGMAWRPWQEYDPLLAERTLAVAYSKSEAAADAKRKSMLAELVRR